MTVNMTVKWLALSALTVVLAVSADAPAHARNAAGDAGLSAHAGAAQDFSAVKYAKKQTDTYNQTKKYR